MLPQHRQLHIRLYAWLPCFCCYGIYKNCRVRSPVEGMHMQRCYTGLPHHTHPHQTVLLCHWLAIATATIECKAQRVKCSKMSWLALCMLPFMIWRLCSHVSVHMCVQTCQASVAALYHGTTEVHTKIAIRVQLKNTSCCHNAVSVCASTGRLLAQAIVYYIVLYSL